MATVKVPTPLKNSLRNIQAGDLVIFQCVGDEVIEHSFLVKIPNSDVLCMVDLSTGGHWCLGDETITTGMSEEEFIDYLKAPKYGAVAKKVLDIIPNGNLDILIKRKG